MQDRYTGDIGDFSKLGILRALEKAGMSVGLNWYLTPDENHNSDGRHVQYLNQDRFKACDEALWLELRGLVYHGQRKVCFLENWGSSVKIAGTASPKSSPTVFLYRS